MAYGSPHEAVEGTVAPNGDVVVPGAALRPLGLVPGQHVRVHVAESRPRRNMRGVLAGKLPTLAEEDFRAVRAEMWRDFPDERAS